MLNNQLTFDFSAAARRNDPITSHRAADTMNQGDTLTEHERFALDAIRTYPGRTAAELESLVQCKPGKIWKRISRLVKKGDVARTYTPGCREGKLWIVQGK